MTTLILQHKAALQQPNNLLHKFKSVGATLRLWMDRQHQRKQLAKLDAHLLRDIGLDSNQVEQELAKPFWK